MIISVIVAHPDRTSFNHALAGTICVALEKSGHTVRLHDLYEERFDPLLQAQEFNRDAVLPPQVEEHCRELREADGIVVIHPNWWGQPPAILKGWVDRVIRPGLAYEFIAGDQGDGVPNGLLRATAALVFNTSNTEPEREIGVFGDPLETIWRNCIFGLCGITRVYRRTFSIVVTSSDEQRANWLDEAAETVRRYFPASD